MASTNQSPFYQKAQQEYLASTTSEDRIHWLKEMIKECPKHKSSEKMLSELKTRLKKLIERTEKQKKSGKSTQKGIKKQDMQCLILGFENTGKSLLFNILTNQDSKISEYPFATYEPKLGTFYYEDAQIQLIDMPSFPNTELSLIHNTDTILLIIDNLEQIEKSKEFLKKTKAKRILIHTKIDLMSEQEKRKIEANLNTKYKKEFEKIFLLSLSNPNEYELNLLKKEIFLTFPIIRVYTKEPRKEPSKDPMILKKDSTIQDTAEKILKGFSKKIKRTRIWGPSSKFGGQIVGLNHALKDKDIIEFQTN
jgi:hypothetical protein